jgi:hypothetical protein
MGELVRACIDKLALETRGRNIEWEIAPLPRSSTPTRPSCSWRC